MACSGAPDEACVGLNQLSLYERTAAAPIRSSVVTIDDRAELAPNSTSIITTPTPTPEPKVGWFYEGCYVDGPGPRTLPNGAGVQGGMTNQKCRDVCQAGGYVLAGTEYAGECKCLIAPLLQWLTLF